MRIIHQTPDQYRTSAWSGGTTTEIFIWPQGASYATRQFAVRVSSAVVELEESDFTALPGVERFITPLQGGFTLIHPGKEPIAMGPMAAPYRFWGDEETHCVGKATDFNLMLQGTTGEMTVASGEAVLQPGIHCLYAPAGGTFTVAGKSFVLENADSLLIFLEEPVTARLPQCIHCYICDP